LTSGLRPDEDLLRDLRNEGFESPQLFRTCAQLWLEVAGQGKGWWAQSGIGVQAPSTQDRPRPEVPEGEQFLDLVHWLEMGLTRLEVEAIKARGVSQLLGHLEQALAAVAPPDLTEVARQTKAAWDKPIAEEAAAAANVLLETVEPYHKEIEHHFALEGQQRFHGMMAAYLRFVGSFRSGTSRARWRLPLVPRIRTEPQQPPAWDLANFTRSCTEVAGTKHLDARIKALANRLLVDADLQGFPLTVLNDPVESRTALDWRQRYSTVLVEVLHQVEQAWAQPKGMRRVLQAVIVFLADWLPPLAVLAAVLNLLWRIFDPWSVGYQVSWAVIFLPLIVLIAVLVLMHLLIVLLLPFRWSKIRGEFAHHLEERLRQELESTYLPIPGEIAEALCNERRAVEKVVNEVREVASWLQQRERSASIEVFYGH
jgi:hypothetical protein